jgi:hypothetical protein
MAVDLPSDWLSAESIVTLTGASAAVVAIANTAWKIAKWNPLRVGSIASLLIIAYGTYLAGTYSSLPGLVMAVVNWCVLFSMAFGIDESLSSFAKIDLKNMDVDSAAGRSWLVPWIS